MPNLPSTLTQFTGYYFTWPDVGVLITIFAGFPLALAYLLQNEPTES